MCRFGALFALPLATAISAVCLSFPAMAAELPQIKISDGNKVPECATPGRLSAFLEIRNKSLNARFEAIAADYMRIGEELGIRWDVAYFQMLLETGNLTFTGDVSEEQNNFAGLGATGKKEPGETFPDVATGVKAHLQHLLMYAGDSVENPVAERTRKVQEWGVLTSWQKTIDGPMTYAHLAKKWAPGSRNYSRDIANVSESFYDGLCKSADPKPDMMALARPIAETKTAKAETEAKSAAQEAPEAASDELTAPKVSGAELARRAVAEAGLSHERADVRAISPMQDLLRQRGVIRILRRLQRALVDKQRLCQRDLHCVRRLHQVFQRILEIVALVDHVRDVRHATSAGIQQFEEDQEELVRLDAAGRQVVVAVLAVVEVKASELSNAVQTRDNLFDVDVRRMVSKIDEAFCLRAEFLGGHERTSPIGNHRGIKGGLKQFVFEQHQPVAGQRRVHRRSGGDVAVECAGEILLSGKV